MHINPLSCTNTSQRHLSMVKISLLHMKYKSIKYEDVIRYMLTIQNQLTEVIMEEL